eukprot:GDKJ01028421.1.p1 GENE.GDKJ01028421.1~~GDKJ01028421.1.p1  ORF type:complete len:123 (+),score=5.70 GDKJ01028421.1:803-1171(+)
MAILVMSCPHIASHFIPPTPISSHRSLYLMSLGSSPPAGTISHYAKKLNGDKEIKQYLSLHLAEEYIFTLPFLCPILFISPLIQCISSSENNEIASVKWKTPNRHKRIANLPSFRHTQNKSK